MFVRIILHRSRVTRLKRVPLASCVPHTLSRRFLRSRRKLFRLVRALLSYFSPFFYYSRHHTAGSWFVLGHSLVWYDLVSISSFWQTGVFLVLFFSFHYHHGLGRQKRLVYCFFPLLLPHIALPHTFYLHQWCYLFSLLSSSPYLGSCMDTHY